jgi:hypothetical protein
MNYKRIPVMIDAATGRQIDENGRAVNSDAEFMRLMYAETCVVCATFYNLHFNNGIISMTPYPLPANAVFICMGDSDFDSSNSLMFFSAQSSGNDNTVDIPGDWFDGGNPDRALGQVSFRINTNTERFIEVLSANRYEYSNAFFSVEMIPAGETSSSAMASFRFKAVNRVASTAGMPVSNDPEYLNKTQIEAMLASIPAYQESLHADNTEIHITSAERTAWNAKADATALAAHTGNTANPHGVTKAQIGLGNTDNTSDADKPISTATQTALNAKANAADIPSDLSELSDTSDVIGGRINALRPTLTEDKIYYIGTSGKPTVQVTSIVADGSTAVATVTGTHAFAIGDSINLDSTVNFNGTFVLTAVTATSLTWSSAVTATENSLSYTYARYLQSVGYAEIQALLDSAPRDAGGYNIIFKLRPGAYFLSEAIRLERFHHGVVYLVGEDDTMHGTKFIINSTNGIGAIGARNCSSSVFIRTMTVENTSTAEVHGAVCISVSNLPLLKIEAVRVMLPNAPVNYESNGISGDFIALFAVYGCSFYGGRTGISVNSSFASIYWSVSSGKDPQYGMYLGVSAAVGEAPTGQIADIGKVASTPL